MRHPARLLPRVEDIGEGSTRVAPEGLQSCYGARNA